MSTVDIPKVHLVMNGERGIGRSTSATILAQWLSDGDPERATCIDTDSINATPMRVFATVRVPSQTDAAKAYKPRAAAQANRDASLAADIYSSSPLPFAALDVNQARRGAIVQCLGSADTNRLPVVRNLGNMLRNARERVVNGLQLLLLDGQCRLARPATADGTGRSSGSTSARSASSPEPASLPEPVLASPRSARKQEPAA